MAQSWAMVKVATMSREQTYRRSLNASAKEVGPH